MKEFIIARVYHKVDSEMTKKMTTMKKMMTKNLLSQRKLQRKNLNKI